MNHIYRLVWNTKRHMLMAVAEVGNAQGKEGGKTGTRQLGDESGEPFQGVRKALVVAVAALFPLVSFAQSSYYPDVIAEGENVTLGFAERSRQACHDVDRLPALRTLLDGDANG